MSTVPRQIYEERRVQFAREEEDLMRQYSRLGYVRLISFILAIGIFILLIQNIGWLAGVFLLLSIGAFGSLVRYHEGIKRQADFANRVGKINELELKSLQFDYSWNLDGSSFADFEHPYLSDLDVFGQHSLFQYVNRCATAMGQRMLATWFRKGALEQEISQRQEAIKELVEAMEFRQHLGAEGLLVKDDPEDLQVLQQWLQTENYLLGKKGVWLAKWVLPPMTLAFCILIAYYISLSYAWIPLVIPGYLMYRTNEKITQINNDTERVAQTLKSYSLLLSKLETTAVNSPLLIAEQKKLLVGKESPSKLIAQLGYRIEQLSVRQNFFGVLFNLISMWDFHWVTALEKSKGRIAPEINEWFSVVATFESLSSFANLWFNNPDYCLPSLADHSVKADQLGHPLIPTLDRVNNSIDLRESAHVMLITGSNMAGKSTFLRAVGVNLVLANAGGPVCADSFEFSARPIYTSMRVADALEDGASSFYAELAKLKKVIDAVKVNPKVVFLLDEILKGTNSGDRNKGSEALLKQLLRYGGTGLVATHDLALTKMESQYPDDLQNWYFDVLIDNDKLAFDYKIKRGICQSFNATLLMKQMGIEMEN